MTLALRRLPVTPLRQNCTIFSNEAGHAFIIDPGGESDRIFQEVAHLHVEAILLTHGHLDHAGGARPLRDLLKTSQGKAVPILGPTREDAFLLQSIEKQAAAFGLSGMTHVEPDRYLSDGDTLHLLGHDIEVAHVPGHTPGHVVFIDRLDKRAIVGDTLFRGTVGRTDFAYGNMEQLLSHIEQKLFCLPDETIVLSGHGLPTVIGVERLTNPAFQGRRSA